MQNSLSHILKSTDNEQEIAEYILLAFRMYVASRNSNEPKYKDIEIPKEFIRLYYGSVNPDYSKMIYHFKNKYIKNEALVEKNDTKEEKEGLGLMYDYIQNIDPDKSQFNIFTNGMILHQLLYKRLDKKRK